jgi:putative NADH-flavin reductase
VKLVVFGPAGRTGRHVVERALGHGHSVTAFVHNTALGLEHPSLTMFSGDVFDFEVVSSAVAGQTAVAFALSGAGNHEPGISNVIHAMAEHGVRRLSAVSAAGTFARTDRALSLGYRALVATALRSTYDDLEAMELRIMASDLDWTIVRPVGLTDDPASGDYRISLEGTMLPKATRISREDVAALVLKSLETDTYHRRAVVIAQ